MLFVFRATLEPLVAPEVLLGPLEDARFDLSVEGTGGGLGVGIGKLGRGLPEMKGEPAVGFAGRPTEQRRRARARENNNTPWRPGTMRPKYS